MHNAVFLPVVCVSSNTVLSPATAKLAQTLSQNTISSLLEPVLAVSQHTHKHTLTAACAYRSMREFNISFLETNRGVVMAEQDFLFKGGIKMSAKCF